MFSDNLEGLRGVFRKVEVEFEDVSEIRSMGGDWLRLAANGSKNAQERRVLV